MKCFVASAFGKSDVDAIYDRCIVPVLKALDIQAIRVDRVEHNEEIDKKILDLLGEADLVVADITYARPSVYYEAGHAAGQGKPVIYIARDDHFRARDDDPSDNLRVHFDLQMKNIIAWRKPDAQFAERLRKRVQLVTKPLRRSAELQAALADERTSFGRLPTNSQIGLPRSKAADLLAERSFVLLPPDDAWRHRLDAIELSRVTGTIRQVVRVVCMQSATKRLFDGVELVKSLGVPYDLSAELHYCVATLASVPRSRASASLVSFTTLADGSYHYAYLGKSRKVDVYVHVFAGVKSDGEFEEAFRSVLDRYRLN